jgi:hypothetical protein
MKQLSEELIVRPGSRIKMADRDPRILRFYLGRCRRASGKNLARLSVLQYLYMRARRGFWWFCRVDAGGKDGTIRHVMTGLNPQAFE